MKKIPRHIIDGFSSPQDDIRKQLDIDFAEIQSQLPETAKGLVVNVCRKLFNKTGEPVQVERAEFLRSWELTSAAREQVETVVVALEEKNILKSDEGNIEFANSVLGRIVRNKIDGDTRDQRPVEAMVATQFGYYEKGKRGYLSEDELAAILPFLGELVLPQQQVGFVEASKHEVEAQKKRRRRRLLVFMLWLTGLALLASVGWFMANKKSIEARKLAELAMTAEAKATDQKLAAEAARDSAIELRKLAEESAERERIQKDSAEARNQRLLAAEIKINALVDSLKRQNENEKAARRRAERNEEEADSLRKLAVDRELLARAAQDSVEVEKKRVERAAEKAQYLSDVLFSRVLARRSIDLPKGYSDIKAFMAKMARDLNEGNPYGDPYHPDIYRSTYYARKALEGKEYFQADQFNGGIRHLKYNPADQRLYLAMSYGGILSGKPGEGAMSDLKAHFPTDRYAIHNMEFDQDYAGMLCGGDINRVIYLDFSKKNSVQEFEMPDGKLSVNIAGGGAAGKFIVQAEDGMVYLLNIKTGEFKNLPALNGARRFTLIPHSDIVIFVDEKPSAIQNVAASTMNRQKEYPRLKAWRYKSTNPPVFLADLYDPVTALNIRLGPEYVRNQDMQIAIGFSNGSIEVYFMYYTNFLRLLTDEKKSGRIYQEIIRSNLHKGMITDMQFNSSGTGLGVSSADGTATLWNLHTWKDEASTGEGTSYQPMLLDDHEGWVMSCTFGPGDACVYTGTKNGWLKYWDLRPNAYADRLCELMSQKALTRDQWREYIGRQIEYKTVCDN